MADTNRRKPNVKYYKAELHESSLHIGVRLDDAWGLVANSADNLVGRYPGLMFRTIVASTVYDLPIPELMLTYVLTHQEPKQLVKIKKFADRDNNCQLFLEPASKENRKLIERPLPNGFSCDKPQRLDFKLATYDQDGILRAVTRTVARNGGLLRFIDGKMVELARDDAGPVPWFTLDGFAWCESRETAEVLKHELRALEQSSGYKHVTAEITGTPDGPGRGG